MIAVNQASHGNHQLFNHDGLIAWIAEVPGSKDRYLALFNARDGQSGSCRVRDLWLKKDVGVARGTLSRLMPPHGAVLLRLTPTL